MQILEDAGAYLSIKEHAQNRLSEADEVPKADLPGLDCLHRCVHQLVPELEHVVSVRRYLYSFPRALYRDGCILLAQPGRCKKCSETKCSCWFGPALVRLMQEYDPNMDLDDIFWEYNREKKLADGEERVLTQGEAEDVAPKQEGGDYQPNTNAADTEDLCGFPAGCASEDDGSTKDSGNASQTVRGAASAIGHIHNRCPSNSNSRHNVPRAADARSKVRTSMALLSRLLGFELGD